jgi:hypothetical protein
MKKASKKIATIHQVFNELDKNIAKNNISIPDYTERVKYYFIN